MNTVWFVSIGVRSKHVASLVAIACVVLACGGTGSRKVGEDGGSSGRESARPSGTAGTGGTNSVVTTSSAGVSSLSSGSIAGDGPVAGGATGGTAPLGSVGGAETGGAAPATGGAAPATGGAAPATGGAGPATGGAGPATGGAASTTGGADAIPPSSGGSESCTATGSTCDTGKPGICSVGVVRCQSGASKCVANATASEELCDGLDNDCDGNVDNGNPGSGLACNTGRPGICAPGTTDCANGAVQCVPNAAVGAELCDGLDNDCDGNIDNGNPGSGLACSTGRPGICAPGTTNCSNGAVQCVQNSVAAAEVCDGLDNDCDGSVDNGNPGSGIACNTGRPGICAPGMTDCANGAVQCVQIVVAATELCDGVDNDCDGNVDNGNPGSALACNTGRPGICAPGTTDCANGAVQCVQNSVAAAEVCDGLDNDCDGNVDNGNPGGGLACDTGRPGVCAPGTTNCANSAVQCVQTVAAATELCDGRDNDCDGNVDNGNPGGGLACDTGLLGVCAVGRTDCSNATVACVETVLPTLEICDGLDNDCNGVAEYPDELQDSDADHVPVCADCNDADPDVWSTCSACVDSDADGRFAGCDAYVNRPGPDCDDTDSNNWNSCQTCADHDGDGYFGGCDAYAGMLGPDCDDSDTRARTCAKNVILFIGDGMGFHQVRAGRCFANGNTLPLAFETLPHTAQMTTACADAAVTDSAASASAMATGHKVNYGALSVALPGDGSDLQTVLELRKQRGQATGLITIYDSIVDATPAGFGAHASSRYNTSEIANDLLTGSKPNLLFGGSSSAVSSSAFVSAGYSYIDSAAALLSLDRHSVQSVLGVFSHTTPALPERTAVALDILEESSKGFFLLVEQANTDKEGHNNRLAPVVAAVVELEAAVNVALAWAASRNDTLIIVTADHETGGLNCSIADYTPTTAGVVPSDVCVYTVGNHTAANVPVFAAGLGAENVSGTIDNIDIYYLLAGFGLPKPAP